MIEFSLELILGIIGSGTGIVGLILHWLKFRKEKPIIEIEFHKSEIKGEDKKFLSMELSLHNKGNLPTSLTKIDLIVNGVLKENADVYKLRGWGMQPEDFDVGIITFPEEILSNSTIQLRIEDELIPTAELIRIEKEKKVKCNIIFYHTHGKISKYKEIVF